VYRHRGSECIGRYYVVCILTLSTSSHLSYYFQMSLSFFLSSSLFLSLSFCCLSRLPFVCCVSCVCQYDVCAHKHALKTATHTGTCTSSGVCTCDAGRWGNTCQNKCPGGEMNSCNGHGMCGLQGTCSCWQGWTGWSCGRLLGAFGLALLARLDGSLVGSQVRWHSPPFCCRPSGGTLVSMVQPALVKQLAATSLTFFTRMMQLAAPS